jgi:hypothetical protein
MRDGRVQSCLFEHENSTHDETRCGGTYYTNKKFPHELKRKPLMKLSTKKTDEDKKDLENFNNCLI